MILPEPRGAAGAADEPAAAPDERATFRNEAVLIQSQVNIYQLDTTTKSALA
jgi:hypothetical protein